MTNNLLTRIFQHKNKLVPGFTAKYNVSKLVYYEEGRDVLEVIKREKQLKGCSRAKKIELVTKMNPQWKDLSENL